MNSMVQKLMASLIGLVVVAAAGILLLSLLWSSIFVYVKPGQMGVKIAKFGEALDPGQILARPGQRGVQAAVLGEGRHFINPVLERIELKPCIAIPPGKIGVVTSKVGKEPSGDRILVDEDEKGIWRRVLTPGLHRLNPYGYTVETRDAVVIAPGYVGFVTALLGTPTTNRFAGPGERGLRREILQPGIYYLNPYEVKITAVEIGINQVTFAPPEKEVYAQRTSVVADEAAGVQQIEADQLVAEEQRRKSSRMMSWLKRSYSTEQAKKAEEIMRRNVANQVAQQGVEVRSVDAQDEKGAREAPQAITFPSSDAFTISLDATIEWELLPKHVADVMAEFGDVRAIEDKIIIPQSQSIGRLQGSTFKAKDLLLGDQREKFQNVFRETLMEVGKGKNIVIHSAFIRNIILPQQLLLPIRERYIAVEKEQTAKVWEVTKRSAAELQREESLIQQRRREIEARTDALVKLIGAEQTREIERIYARTRKLVAEKQTEIATLDAARTVKLGEADADVKRWMGEADATGFQLKVDAVGDPLSYTRYRLAEHLPTDMQVRIVHTGTGTLWTDLEKTAGAVGAGKLLNTGAESE